MSLIKDIISGGLKGLGDTAKGIIQQVAENKMSAAEGLLNIEKEANRASEAITAQANDIEKAYLADVANSRDSNARIQESDKASWMAKNVAYLIDIALLLAFFAMLTVIIYKIVPEANKEIFYMAFGSLISYVGTTITFHRGTSKGSEDKQRTMDKMLKK